MPKEKIAIISVLKPVDDIRSYHKMARSLLATDEYELHLIGFESLEFLQNTDDCYFHSHEPFDRLSFSRLLIPIKVLWLLLQIKPKQIICNSPELLWISVYAKVLLGARIVYDIQENYKFNLWFQQVYPTPIKQILGLWIRTNEYMCAAFFDHFILAEQCYVSELGFIGRRYTVIENKSLNDFDMVLDSSVKKYDLLFSGTISISNGVLNALTVWKRLKVLQPSMTLKIIGHCSDPKLFNQLQSMREEGMVLDISKHPVSYQSIVGAMSVSKFGLVVYELNPSNERCLPTKVFDCLTYRLPMIYEVGAGWQHFIESNHGGIGINLKVFDESKLLDHIKSFDVFGIRDTSGLWEDEAVRFVQLMEGLFCDKKEEGSIK